jgi:hypothetical protein
MEKGRPKPSELNPPYIARSEDLARNWIQSLKAGEWQKVVDDPHKSDYSWMGRIINASIGTTESFTLDYCVAVDIEDDIR